MALRRALTERPKLSLPGMSFSGGFALVAPRAGRLEIGPRVVVTAADVVDIGCLNEAAGSPDLALMVFLQKHLASDGVPIGWKPICSV